MRGAISGHVTTLIGQYFCVASIGVKIGFTEMSLGRGSKLMNGASKLPGKHLKLAFGRIFKPLSRVLQSSEINLWMDRSIMTEGLDSEFNLLSN